MKKIISIVIDGVGDCSCSTFHYRTPLEEAHTPFLDALAGFSLLSFTFLCVFFERVWSLWTDGYVGTGLCLWL
jgi:hypothetical protein